jgi:hypothetical protein
MEVSALKGWPAWRILMALACLWDAALELPVAAAASSDFFGYAGWLNWLPN